MIAIGKNIKISPKKANLVAQMVRNKPVAEALNLLKFTPKKGAPLLAKIIASASANAVHNFKQSPDKLIIKEIIVNKGTTLKRSVPISRGRMHPILKFSSHIKVSISVAETPDSKIAISNPKKKEVTKQVKKKPKEVKKTTKSNS